MEKFIPTGFSDYKAFIESNFVYIDKTLFIQELLSKGRGLRLICRPRRFGKTMNLSMLRYFFEKTEKSNAHLFADKAIWQHEEYRELQGQYPVVFLTFKDIKQATWQVAYDECKAIIAHELKRHRHIIEKHADLIDRSDLAKYERIAAEEGSESESTEGIKLLIESLYKITNKTVIVLIDEYDAPIHTAYKYGYYNEMVSFMRDLLSKALKDNAQVEQAILTGILRTSREGIFSGLNNLDVFTLLTDQFADKFGFTTEEVDLFLKRQKVDVSMETIKEWYNGYRAGSSTLLYNPWSIIGCAKNNGVFDTYWANTSDNSLIKKLIAHSSIGLKTELEAVLVGDQTVTKKIDEAFIFPGIEKNNNAIWSLLLFSGYVTYSNIVVMKGEKNQYTLTMPNKEIKELYDSMLTSIFEDALSTRSMTELFEALLAGDAQKIETILQNSVLTSASSHDLPETLLEQGYHMFVLGLLAHMSSKYQVRSNRESGSGRYDIMLIPKKQGQIGILIEFKKAKSHTKKAMESAVQEAFKQIKDQKYIHELHAHDVEKSIIYGIGVYGKQLSVKSEWVN